MRSSVILMYHAIAEARTAAEAPYCTPPSLFREHMRWLVDNGHTPVSMDDLLAPVRPERQERMAVAVTFDDGYTDLLANALPILAQLGLPATAFAVSGLLGGWSDWDAWKEIPRRRLLSADGLRELARGGVSIGSHGEQHRGFNTLSLSEVRAELAGSRRRLEDILGHRVADLAFPYGQFDRAVVDVARQAGYRSALTVIPGINRPGDDPMTLRRVNIGNHVSTCDLARIVEHGSASRLGLLMASMRAAKWKRHVAPIHNVIR
ncbi:MAG: polysaccharide deacetylase family protein [Burkholderiaceae bacterium]